MHKLRRARLERGLSQAQLAELAGVHAQTVLHLENGRYSPSELTIWKIARALEIDPEVLLEDLAAAEDADHHAVGSGAA